MKKLFLILVMLFCVSANITFAADKYSEDYLKNHKHFAIMNPIAESIAENVIKSSLKSQTGGKYKVKFEGYTLSSMKKGIFKNLEITGKEVVAEGITVPYVHFKSLSDYNYVDYTKNPVEIKSNMQFQYDLLLSNESLNSALQNGNYQTVLNNINKITYPLFQIKGVSTKIVDNKLYILTEYNFPIAPSPKNKVFVASSDFVIQNGKIKAVNVKLNSAYGNISLNKVANLLNLLNPLEFTLNLLDNNEYKGNVENVNIVDNMVKVDGKIFVKGKV